MSDSSNSGVNRRQFISSAALATAGVALASRSAFGQAGAANSPIPGTANSIAASNYARALVEAYGRPNSRFNGVLVGTITYSFRALPSSAEELLKYCVALGISGVEMMGGPADDYISGAGAGGALPGATAAQNEAFGAMTAALTPLTQDLQTARTNLAAASLRNPAGSEPIRAAAGEVARIERALADARSEQLAAIQGSANRLNPDQVAAVSAANGGPPAGRGGGRGGGGGGAAMPGWMDAAALARLSDLRRMYDEAGVHIYGLKNVGGGQSDAELDYRFQMAKVLGATHVTLELPTDPAVTERLGAFGQKHRVMVAYHTHTQARLDSFDVALGQSTYNAINVDAGHFVAGTGESVLPMLRKYPDRVGSIHLKDRQTPENGAGNLVWGTGDTDIVEILRTMRDERWSFPASIEYEYSTPAGSNVLTEIGRCRAYAAAALMT
jgi:sugar phosphate isomerase/epimerase